MYEMVIRLRTDSKECLYEQIYLHIKKEIKEGKLLAGEKLPSTRSLAEYLQVARSTVDFAYGQLMDEGYIEAIPCRGYFVCNMDHQFRQKQGDADADSMEAETGLGQIATAGSDQRGTEYRYDFSPYEIDMSGFPFSVWKKITRNILTEVNSDMFARGENQGDFKLRETISRYLHSSRGVNCRPEQIVVGAGNDYLLMLLEKMFGKKLRVAMESPTYLRPYRIFTSCDYEIEPIGMDEDGILVEELRKVSPDAVYVMPSHQFPSGTVMPITRRLELIRWACEEQDRYIIEDDYDSEFRYHGRPIPALMASDNHGRVIYLGSFSKAIAPAIRVSFMVLPEELLTRYRENCYFYSCTVSRIDQCILAEFIRDGYFERHLNKMRKIYKNKHDFLLERLKNLRKVMDISGENAGLHILLTSKNGMSEEELIRRATEAKVKVYGLSEHRPDRGGEQEFPGSEPGTILLGFGGMDITEIDEAVGLLEKCWLAQ